MLVKPEVRLHSFVYSINAPTSRHAYAVPAKHRALSWQAEARQAAILSDGGCPCFAGTGCMAVLLITNTTERM